MGKRIKQEITYRDGFRLHGENYTSFLVYNPVTKKNERIQIEPATPDIEKAKSFRRKVEIKLGVTKLRAEKRFNFLQKFNDQEKLNKEFEKHIQKVAKRSWKGVVSRLHCYVFPFFIGQLNLNHPSLWFEYWQQFQDSIKKPIRKNTKGKELTVNSKDQIIRAANSFIAFVELTEGGSPLKRLPEFKFEEKAQRGIEAVYTEAEISEVHEAFVRLGLEKYADLWQVLSTTGMRVGEGIGIMISDVVFNAVPTQEKWIFNALKDKTEMYGYILLKSQPFDSNNLIIEGQAKRTPLKKRKKIAPEYNRVIPLIDIATAKTLQKLKKDCGKLGLLFEGCSYREFYKKFTEIKQSISLPKEKDIHGLRHTFATNFTKLCEGDPRLAEKVLGHSDPKMTERYNHLAAELQSLAQAANDSEIRPLKIK